MSRSKGASLTHWRDVKGQVWPACLRLWPSGWQFLSHVPSAGEPWRPAAPFICIPTSTSGEPPASSLRNWGAVFSPHVLLGRHLDCLRGCQCASTRDLALSCGRPRGTCSSLAVRRHYPERPAALLLWKAHLNQSIFINTHTRTQERCAVQPGTAVTDRFLLLVPHIIAVIELPLQCGALAYGE